MTFFKKSGQFYGFKTCGHADSAPNGEDIVCAAVSILTQTMYFHALNQGVPESEIADEQHHGFLSIRIKNDHDIERLQPAFHFLEDGLKLLKENYSEYISLEDQEVS
ncbi:ribosomal-processing cysteine protease Prp [Peptoniphilus equinus]|uniref:Ribosomal processing cysteine protease Prp n=1 Tax=Peptoniphilus equinus TaxID=3016343 RepID=A0ABY7QSB3_9FIRM|nr:ribosomal-processing cysteine protease Prp [Peptoniphilus equinus]WBW49216.1 ribosomal-processing cysteine protease Prp [Peptoniphilus equinus]